MKILSKTLVVVFFSYQLFLSCSSITEEMSPREITDKIAYELVLQDPRSFTSDDKKKEFKHLVDELKNTSEQSRHEKIQEIERFIFQNYSEGEESLKKQIWKNWHGFFPKSLNDSIEIMYRLSKIQNNRDIYPEFLRINNITINCPISIALFLFYIQKHSLPFTAQHIPYIMNTDFVRQFQLTENQIKNIIYYYDMHEDRSFYPLQDYHYISRQSGRSQHDRRMLIEEEESLSREDFETQFREEMEAQFGENTQIKDKDFGLYIKYRRILVPYLTMFSIQEPDNLSNADFCVEAQKLLAQIYTCKIGTWLEIRSIARIKDRELAISKFNKITKNRDDALFAIIGLHGLFPHKIDYISQDFKKKLLDMAIQNSLRDIESSPTQTTGTRLKQVQANRKLRQVENAEKTSRQTIEIDETDKRLKIENELKVLRDIITKRAQKQDEISRKSQEKKQQEIRSKLEKALQLQAEIKENFPTNNKLKQWKTSLKQIMTAKRWIELMQRTELKEKNLTKEDLLGILNEFIVEFQKN